MKQVVVISLLVFSSLGIVEAQSVMEPEKDEIMRALEEHHISTKNQLAYEQLAIQKWRDMLDYIQLIMDEKLPIEMRQVAYEEVLKVMPAKQMQPKDWLLANELQGFWTTQKILDRIQDQPQKYALVYQNISLLEPLQWQKHRKYKGVLTYDQRLKGTKRFQTKQVSFYLTKNIKKFGNTEVEIWQVSFGQILP
jgi:hypothetical protein